MPEGSRLFGRHLAGARPERSSDPDGEVSRRDRRGRRGFVGKATAPLRASLRMGMGRAGWESGYLFGRPLVWPRNVHVHSEAVHVHVHVHDDAASSASTCTSTRGCQSARSLSRSKSKSIPALHGAWPSWNAQASLPGFSAPQQYGSGTRFRVAESHPAVFRYRGR
jgi:hypothetical protein